MDFKNYGHLRYILYVVEYVICNLIDLYSPDTCWGFWVRFYVDVVKLKKNVKPQNTKLRGLDRVSI